MSMFPLRFLIRINSIPHGKVMLTWYSKTLKEGAQLFHQVNLLVHA